MIIIPITPTTMTVIRQDDKREKKIMEKRRGSKDVPTDRAIFAPPLWLLP